MSETVLSKLCSICHVEPPKYKCPRCNARTCSLQCIQKHKTRADCDGQRNPRAFIPITQLRTPAGLDHDFNFISSIERACRRTEAEIVESRRLVDEKELHPSKEKEEKQFEKVWEGDELRHIPTTNKSRHHHHQNDTFTGSGVVGFDKWVRRRLRYLDVEVIAAPKGMSRQKENRTSFNRRTNTINWQIEWFIYDPQAHPETPFRLCYKSLEGNPLYHALSSALDWHRAVQDPSCSSSSRKPKRKSLISISPAQSPSTSAWAPSFLTIQSPLHSAWSLTTRDPSAPIPQEEIISKYRFYLLKPTGSPHLPQTKLLIPLRSTTCLTEALKGRTVVEFPTILVFAPEEEVPEGYAILTGDGDRRERNVKEQDEGEDESGGEDDGEIKTEREDGHDQWNGRKRTFDTFERGGRGGRGRGRGKGRGGRGGGRGTYENTRGGKRARFERGERLMRDEEQAEEGDVKMMMDEPNLDEEGEIQEEVEMDMAGMGLDEINQVVQMDVGVMMGDGQAPSRGAAQQERSAGGGGMLVDYGSDDED